MILAQDTIAITSRKPINDTAVEAKQKAETTEQYFWSDASGAHITEIPKDTFEQNPSGSNLLATSTGIAVRDGSTDLATFGASGAQVGKSEESKVTIVPSGIDMYGYDASAETPQQLLCHIGYASGNAETGTAIKPYYSFGSRRGAIGNWSVAEGVDTVASGYASHAEGSWLYQTQTGSDPMKYTTASGGASHAEGYGTTASGKGSHAEGSGTTASGSYSHAEGDGCTASGYASHASGEGTEAQGVDQTAIGAWNVVDANDTYLLIIGNGGDKYEKSNAFVVDWDGIVRTKGDIYVGCNADSTGGRNISGNTTGTYTLTATTGVFSSGSWIRNNNVVQLTILFHNTSSVSSGGKAFEATLPSSVPTPVQNCMGCAYFGSHALTGVMRSNRNVTIVNAHPSAVTMGSTDARITFTYITA